MGQVLTYITVLTFLTIRGQIKACKKKYFLRQAVQKNKTFAARGKKRHKLRAAAKSLIDRRVKFNQIIKEIEKKKELKEEIDDRNGETAAENANTDLAVIVEEDAENDSKSHKIDN